MHFGENHEEEPRPVAAPATAAPATAAPAATSPRPSKRRRRSSYAAMMGSILAPTSRSPQAAEEADKKALLRHLGGGAFSKLDKI